MLYGQKDQTLELVFNEGMSHGKSGRDFAIIYNQTHEKVKSEREKKQIVLNTIIMHFVNLQLFECAFFENKSIFGLHILISQC